MRTSGDKPWELILDPEQDKVLVCAQLNRPVGCTMRHPHKGNCTAEGLAMPYDSPVQILSMAQAQAQKSGTWRVELWAPTARAAREIAHTQMRQRRVVTLGETR